MNARHDFQPCDLSPTPPETVRETKHTSRTDGPRAALRAPGRVRSALVTGGTLAALWAGLHWDDPQSWVIGAPTVLLGAGAAALVPPSTPPRLSLRGALGFAAFAAVGVMRGAIDVSLRALRPHTLRPGRLVWRTYLPPGRPRRLFALTITLLPGTLTARLDGDTLIVHALDRGAGTRADLGALEARVAALFKTTKPETWP
ncbi:putative monovalent cation/H+ antiporter subunit E [Roseivivax jejudonensis]|uniref:Putative monovalent cation/H+ antiporter subunit E n=1 Tax=Roseivivax jejudonensis TaxID=1529041 RepID=A0A1X6Y6X9_9RHOB|nr:Na+/H+ antiporter subunit E [Roseivivax jejudonensis]SLN12148.1 putative monovalent cation/H+ antiporter subunit E [Roseivivax jejudonensis]